MPRIAPIRRLSEGPTDGEAHAALARMFAGLFPGQTDPAIDERHDGLALAAHSPALAAALARTSAALLVEGEWADRPRLRELAIQVAARRHGYAYGFETRVAAARAAGLTPDQLAALPDAAAGAAFDADQRLVIAYVEATVAGTVDDALSDRAIAAFGTKATVELAAIAAFWTFWSMFIAATRGDG